MITLKELQEQIVAVRDENARLYRAIDKALVLTHIVGANGGMTAKDHQTEAEIRQEADRAHTCRPHPLTARNLAQVLGGALAQWEDIDPYWIERVGETEREDVESMHFNEVESLRKVFQRIVNHFNGDG